MPVAQVAVIMARASPFNAQTAVEDEGGWTLAGSAGTTTGARNESELAACTRQAEKAGSSIVARSVPNPGDALAKASRIMPRGHRCRHAVPDLLHAGAPVRGEG